MKSHTVAWRFYVACLSAVCLFGGSLLLTGARRSATAETPLRLSSAAKRVTIDGTIYPDRFNRARGDGARYHLLTWKGGHAKNALIETPVDDLVFHDALVEIGARPGNTLSMTAWTRRTDPDSHAPRQKAGDGSRLAVFLSWSDRPGGPTRRLPVHHVFHPSGSPPPVWTFEGNRDRWFNRAPFAQRPGCLACLYSCPSGKLGNGGLSIADYMASQDRFRVDTEKLPPDGTAVRVTFELLP